MSESLKNGESRKAALKRLIRELHEGIQPEDAKAQFREVIRGVAPDEISRIEEELVKEGMPAEEIHRLCDVHLAVFKESLEREETLAPAGHPIHILMEEHKMLLGFADQLRRVAEAIEEESGSDSAIQLIEQLGGVAGRFKSSESHYLREENVLFPYLEKHGVTQPPAIMWMEHDKIREIEKSLYQIIDARESMAFPDFAGGLRQAATDLSEMLSSHFYKENNILYPTALKVMDEDEWREARRQFDELGYCPFTPRPEAALPEEGKRPATSKPEAAGELAFETGSLHPEQLEAILNALPVDITFVDKDDRVRYFNQAKDRIFPRTKAVIGREVQNCHPKKSLHAVTRILEDFRAGRKDSARFWIDMEGRLIHIQYFPVRGPEGEYIGCLEVTQDITDVKGIEGEKRLL